jgi:hypothetical protein
MGNALAGHAHWQLHSPFLAACSAAAAFPFPPGLATSLTGGPAADVVVVAIRPLFVGEAVLTEVMRCSLSLNLRRRSRHCF